MDAIQYHLDSACRYTVKVHGFALDKYNIKSGVYEAIKFRTKVAAEKAALAKIALNRKIAL